MMNLPPSVAALNRYRRSAFSLVEVAIALVVLSFAVISIIGLLPAGLNQLRESMNQTVEAQIVSAIAGQALVTGFENLGGTNYFFDDEGLPVLPSDPNAFYRVGVMPQEPAFPGSQSSYGTDSLLRLQIVIEDLQRPNRATTHTIQVANYGK